MKSGKRGFTLIEVLVSLVILTVGVTAMLSLLLTSIKVNNDTKERLIAQDGLVQEIEALRAVGYTGMQTSDVARNSLEYSVFDELSAEFRLEGIVKTCDPDFYCVYKELKINKEISDGNGSTIDAPHNFTLRLSVDPRWNTEIGLASATLTAHWMERGSLKSSSQVFFVGNQ